MPLSTRLSRSALVVAASVLVLSGCGGDQKNAATVSGKVTVDSQPMTKGSVRFVPDKAKGNTGSAEPVGQIAESGQYELTTNGKPGAPLGWYTVTVASGEIPDSGKPFATKGGVAPRFAQAETSKLSVEVVAAPAAGAYDLKVSAK